MQADILMQAALVALEGQQVIAAFIGNFLGDGFLPSGAQVATHGINGHDGSADIQPLQ
jgi:hypothetical protein